MPTNADLVKILLKLFFGSIAFFLLITKFLSFSQVARTDKNIKTNFGIVLVTLNIILVVVSIVLLIVVILI